MDYALQAAASAHACPLACPCRVVRKGFAAKTHTHKHILTHAYKLLAQVATKVVVQNARLPIAPVEQVRQRMVSSLQAFPYSHFVQGYVPRGIRYSDGGMLAHRYGPIEPLAGFLTPTVMLARMSCESQTPPSARPWRRPSRGSRTCTASRCRPTTSARLLCSSVLRGARGHLLCSCSASISTAANPTKSSSQDEYILCTRR